MTKINQTINKYTIQTIVMCEKFLMQNIIKLF